MTNAVGARSRSAWGVLCALACLSAPTAEPGGSTQGADVRPQAVRALLAQGRYAEAEATAEHVFPVAADGSFDASTDPGVGDLLVEALIRNGRGAETRTRAIAENIVRVKASRIGAAHASLAPSIRNLAEALLESAEYVAALARFREALALREQSPDAARADIADDLDYLTKALTQAGEPDQALVTSTRALEIRNAAGSGQGDLAFARTLRLRGVVMQRKARSADARASFERALALVQERHPAHPETALVLTMLGFQLTIDGELLPGNDMLRDAVSLARKVFSPAHPELAMTLRSLAANLQELGHFAESRELREQAAAIAGKALGPDHPALAEFANDLANIHLLTGDYVGAQRLYEQASALYERRLGPSAEQLPTASFNLALVHTRLGDVHEARRYLESAIAAWTRRLGPGHANVARAVSALADLLADQGEEVEAQRHYDRAARIRERALGLNHPQLAWTLRRSAENLVRLGRLQPALGQSARAVRICETAQARQCQAGALHTHAGVLSASGKHADAARTYERSLAIRLQTYASEHPLIAETEIALALERGHLRQNQDALSGALRGAAIDRHHSRLTLSYLSGRQALEYAAQRRGGLDLALSLPADAGRATDLLDAVVLGRALVLDELGARQRILAAQRGTLAPLWSELASARQRYANLVIRGPSEQRPQQHAALVDDARRSKELAERQLAEQSAAFKAELGRTEIGLEEVRTNIQPGTALVSFVRFNRSSLAEKANAATASVARGTAARSTTVPSYVAFVLRPEAEALNVVHLGSAATIDSLIAQWRRELVTSATQPTAAPRESERALRATGLTLRRKLWDPVAGHLKGVDRVFVVPDGAINLVPFTALPTAQTRYLLDDGPVIHYLSAERDLADPAATQAPQGLLAVGGPAFADGSVFAALSPPAPARADARAGPAPANPLAPAGSYRSGAASCASFRSLQFRVLPGSRREVEEVAGLWRNASAPDVGNQVLTGRDASERTLKQLAAGHRILHLATHGFFLDGECSPGGGNTRSIGGLVASNGQKPKPAAASPARRRALPENPLLLSGLAFAGANRRAAAGPDEDDGILTAEEVASLNLHGTEWAVLSACDTGLGEIKAGEGVFGLRRAFQIAGARTVIMSLWSVDDQATRGWMRALYDGRLNERLSTADAMRAASLSVLRDRRARGLSTHPFYWAAFVAAGDWR